MSATGTVTGSFENLPTLLQDNIGWSEFTGAFVSAAALPKNTYFIEQATGVGGGFTFHYNVEGSVPDPGTAGMAALGLLLLRGMKQRRRSA